MKFQTRTSAKTQANLINTILPLGEKSKTPLLECGGKRARTKFSASKSH